MKKIIFIYIVIFLFSCSSGSPKKETFLVEPDYGKVVKKTSPVLRLRLGKFRISSFFESKGFVYKKSDVAFESDYYNEFLVFPASNITEAAQRWLTYSGSMDSLPPAISDEARTTLSANIHSLYADLRDSKNPKSVLEIEFFLTQDLEAKLIYRGLFRKEIALKEKNPESIVRGWNQALTEIFTQVENEIRRVGMK